MTQPKPDIAALIGSRICHDMISPVGAVVNGLELVAMSMASEAPEFALVTESAENAAARIRFFRLVFGAAEAGQMVSGEEVAEILGKVYGPTRFTVNWPVRGAQERRLVKAALLAVLCVETALQREGKITVSLTDGRWRVQAESDRLSMPTELWDGLETGVMPDALPPSAVQFALIGPVLAEAGRTLAVQRGAQAVALAF